MRTKFLGIPLDVLSLERVREDVVRAVQTRKSIVHCSLNALKAAEARRDPGTRKLIEHFDLITPDGMSVVWGRRLLGEGRTEQVAGVELTPRRLTATGKRHLSFFILWGKADGPAH